MLILFAVCSCFLWFLKAAKFQTPAKWMLWILLVLEAGLLFERGHHPELEAAWKQAGPSIFGLEWRLEAAQAFLLAWLFGLSAFVLLLESLFKDTYHRKSQSIFLLGLLCLAGVLTSKTPTAWLLCYGGLLSMGSLHFLLRVDTDAAAKAFRRFTFFQVLAGSCFIGAVLLLSVFPRSAWVGGLMLLGLGLQWGLYPLFDEKRQFLDWRQFWLEEVFPNVAVFSCLLKLDEPALPAGSLEAVAGVGALTLLVGLVASSWSSQFRLWFAGLQSWLLVFFWGIHPSQTVLMGAFLSLTLLASILLCIVGHREGARGLRGFLLVPLVWFALGGQGSVAEWRVPLESASALLPMGVGFLVALLTMKMCLAVTRFVSIRGLTLSPLLLLAALSTSHLVWYGSLSVKLPLVGVSRGIFMTDEGWLHPIWSIVCLLGLSLSALWSFGRKPFWRIVEERFKFLELDARLHQVADLFGNLLSTLFLQFDEVLDKRLLSGVHFFAKTPRRISRWLGSLEERIQGSLMVLELQVSKWVLQWSNSFNHGELRLYGFVSVLFFVGLFVWTGWWV